MHERKIRAGVVGITGYSGMEMIRILTAHPSMSLTRVTSRKEAGEYLRDLFPYIRGQENSELLVTSPEAKDLAESCDLVFLAVPHGAAMPLAAELVRYGVKVVDLSADFRLRDPQVYKRWYQLDHEQTDLLAQAVYGLPEFYAPELESAFLVANPGCYPTSAILALAPALRMGLAEKENIIVDSKSGATGAGRGAKQAHLFSEVSDNFRAYGLGKHRHTPEMEQEISLAAGEELKISFNPHLLPINRGILSTCYTRLKKDLGPKELVAKYADFYAGWPWVRVLPSGTLPETRWVRGTMFCDLGIIKEPRTDRMIVVSAIDNLCRGASGQAVANANLMHGLPLGAGLGMAPLVP